MVLSCSVQYCKNKLIKGNGIIFHRLPLHDKELLQKWLKALKIDNWTPTKHYNVCSKHFFDDDYKMSPTGVKLADLSCSAVPSIFSESFFNSKQKPCSLTNKRKKSKVLGHLNTKQSEKKKKKTLPDTISTVILNMNISIMNTDECMLVKNIFKQYNLKWKNDDKDNDTISKNLDLIIGMETVQHLLSPEHLSLNSLGRDCYEPVCFVPSCKTPKGLPLYNFPFGDQRLLDIWAERTGLSTLYDPELYLTITICKNHFHENCFHDNSIQLKPYAIPSVNLIDYTGPPDSYCCPSLHSDDNSVMISGDRTWGWLGSTEAFGRPPEPNEFVVIPKSEIHCAKYADSNHAAHCFIYAENNVRVFDIYNPRASVLMHLRYDGYFGFPGGLIDAGEDFVSAVNREMAEEMNLNTTIHSVNHDDHIISHWSEKKNLVLHLYKLKVNMTDLIEIERQASLARDYGTEVLGTVRVPLYTLGDHYRGFPVFLNNKFIGCSRDQLLAALSSLNILTPEEIQLALNANNRNI